MNATAALLCAAAALAAGAGVYKHIMGKHAGEGEAVRARRGRGMRQAAESAGERAMSLLHVSRAGAGKTAAALRRAGIDAPAGSFYAATLALAALGAAVGLALAALAPGAGPVQRAAIAVLACAAGAAAPWLAVRRRARARLTRVEATLAPTLELLAVSSAAGQTIERAVRTVGEWGNGPLAEEFAACARDVSDYGYTASEALGRMAARVGSPGLTAFCSAAAQSLAAGSEIAPVLRAQADMAADEYYTAVEERANKLPVKLILVIAVFILPLLFAVAMLPMLLSLLGSIGGLL